MRSNRVSIQTGKGRTERFAADVLSGNHLIEALLGKKNIFS
jgi:ribosomal protein L16/L10AE